MAPTQEDRKLQNPRTPGEDAKGERTCSGFCVRVQGVSHFVGGRLAVDNLAVERVAIGAVGHQRVSRLNDCVEVLHVVSLEIPVPAPESRSGEAVH